MRRCSSNETMADVAVPSLVGLVGPGPVLHIGIGSDGVSVALYLDSDGRPHWGRSDDGTAWPADREIVFSKDGRDYSFHGSAATTPAVARQLAREFVNAPASPPAGVEWVPDP